MADLPRGGAPPHFAGGRYEVLGVLGSGGTATVYRVRDTSLRVERALKVLRIGNVDLGRRLAAEARMMVQLDNPHILRVVDVGEDEGRPYLVMEYLTGGTLADLAEEGPLPVQSAIGWTLQVLAALSAAHELGIVHRDVKPSNVLLDNKGVARLADFGISLDTNAQEERATRTGVAMGTLAFMAPEQRLDARSVSRSADMYAVGAMLYSLITYRSAMDLFVVQKGDPRLEGIPEALERVLLKATRYEPTERYDTASEMAADLLGLMEALPDEAMFPMEPGANPPERIRTATPGPLGRRIRPPRDVTNRAIDTLIGSGARRSRPTIAPPAVMPETLVPVASEPPRRRFVGALALAALVFVAVVGWVLSTQDGAVSVEPPVTTAPAAIEDIEDSPEPDGTGVIDVPAPSSAPLPPATTAVAPVVAVAPSPPSPLRVIPLPTGQATPVDEPVDAPIDDPPPSGPFPSGRYVGVLDGRPIDLVLRGESDGMSAHITAWFSQADREGNTTNRQSREMTATWEEASRALVLRDGAGVPGAGRIEATWDGRRFSGQFQNNQGTHVTAFEARPR